MMPCRIQRSRAKGWRKPLGAVYVGRGSKWGNPYGTDARCLVTVETAAEAVRLYRAYVTEHADEMPPLSMLRGKTLMCWCALPKPGEPDVCHAAVLLELANEATP